MITKVIFRRIKFENIYPKNFNKYIVKKGLFVFPAGPALATIDKSKKYHESLIKADIVFFDSGFFVLLLKFLKNLSVIKFSGYRFLDLFFNYLNHPFFLDEIIFSFSAFVLLLAFLKAKLASITVTIDIKKRPEIPIICSL